MKVISHNSVNALHEKAEALGQEPHESWRSIYFKFSDKQEKNNHELYSNFIVKPIISMLENSNGYIYLCDDGDIVVLYQGALKPIATKLGQHFGDMDPEDFLDHGDYGMFRAYDLSKQWDAFYELCEGKYYERLLKDEPRRMHYNQYTARAFAAVK